MRRSSNREFVTNLAERAVSQLARAKIPETAAIPNYLSLTCE